MPKKQKFQIANMLIGFALGLSIIWVAVGREGDSFIIPALLITAGLSFLLGVGVYITTRL